MKPPESPPSPPLPPAPTDVCEAGSPAPPVPARPPVPPLPAVVVVFTFFPPSPAPPAPPSPPAPPVPEGSIQSPLTQMPPVPHGVPSTLSVDMQLPVAASQYGLVQSPPEQTIGVPTHTPTTHVSCSVQRSLSSQATPVLAAQNPSWAAPSVSLQLKHGIPHAESQQMPPTQ